MVYLLQFTAYSMKFAKSRRSFIFIINWTHAGDVYEAFRGSSISSKYKTSAFGYLRIIIAVNCNIYFSNFKLFNIYLGLNVDTSFNFSYNFSSSCDKFFGTTIFTSATKSPLPPFPIFISFLWNSYFFSALYSFL